MAGSKSRQGARCEYWHWGCNGNSSRCRCRNQCADGDRDGCRCRCGDRCRSRCEDRCKILIETGSECPIRTVGLGIGNIGPPHAFKAPGFDTFLTNRIDSLHPGMTLSRVSVALKVVQRGYGTCSQWWQGRRIKRVAVKGTLMKTG